MEVGLARRQFHRPFEHRLQHVGGQAAGVLIISRTVVAIDDDPAAGHAMLRQMGEARLGELATQRLYHGLVRDLAQGDEDLRMGQGRDGGLQEGAAVADFIRQRPVLRRQAFDGIENDDVAQRQAVIGPRIINTLGKPEFAQRGEQQVAGIIPGKRAPRPVGAHLAGRKSDDRNPAERIAE